MKKITLASLIHCIKHRPYVAASTLAFLLAMMAYFNGVYAISTDCISRTYFAYAWSKNPTMYQTSLWLPFHSIFYGSVMKIGFFSEIGIAHFLNAFFSAGIIWLSALIVKALSSHEKAVLFTCIALLLSSMRIWLGFSMLSETPYIFLVLGFMYACIRYFQTKQDRYFYLSVILAFCISGYRFSSWPIIFAYSVIIIYQKRSIKHWASVLCMHAFQIYWLYIIYSAYGNPLAGFNFHAKDSIDFYKSGTEPLLFILKNYAMFFGFGSFLSLIGLLQWKNIQPKTQQMALFSISLCLIQSIVVFRHMPTVLPERAIFLSGLCLTLSAVMVFYDLKSFYPKKSLHLYGIACMLLTLNLFAVSTVQPSPSIPMQPIAKVLRNLPSWSGNQTWYVAHDTDRLEGMSLMLLSKKPERFVILKFDPLNKQLQLQSQKQPIVLFLLASQETAMHIQNTWPDSFIIEYFGYYFVSNNLEIKKYISS